MVNYDDALRQILAAGIIVDKPLLFDGRIQRWKVDGQDREKRGWTRLREWVSSRGAVYLVGMFGVWQGNDDNRVKIELPARGQDGSEVSAEDVAAMRAALRESALKLDQERKNEARTAARWAASVWAHCRPCESHEYLTRKGIQAHGLRELTSLDGLTLDGVDDSNWWRLASACEDGQPALVVPMHDVKGQVCGIQFIYGKGHPRRAKTGRDKEFWPSGMAMGGTFGVIGPLYRDGIMQVCEGYATAGSLYEADGLSVAYAFSANNLVKAGKALRGAFPALRLLFCADDDYLTDGNPGVTAAAEATAKIEKSAWIKPDFTGPDGNDLRGGKKLSDFNDLVALHGGIGLPLAKQVGDVLERLEWRRSASQARGPLQQGGGEVRLAIMSADDAVERFSPVWSTDDVYYFDHIERVVVSKASVANRMPRNGWDQVTMHPVWRAKPEVSLQQVDFDPTENDPDVAYNLWGGWKPIATGEAKSCQAILELGRHLCSFESHMTDELFTWVLKWLAYPLQNPGAKMQTCILMHGGQGAGKNTFFDTLQEIYTTEYSVQFGPKQLEKRFNALFSKKLFAIGNEVVASREDLYHVKGSIKHMITERRWVVEAKNKDERWERNCCNFVFLSNEINPQALDRGDRRHCVIWTPEVPDPDHQKKEYEKWQALWAPAHEERKHGGAAALLDYLMKLDLSGFSESTWPPMTQAKQDLIDINMDSGERFYGQWRAEEFDIPFIPVPMELIYDAYRVWAAKSGIGRPMQKHRLLAYLLKQPGFEKSSENLRTATGYAKRAVVFPQYIKEPPPGKSKASWLADCVDEFTVALEGYRA